MRSDIEIPKALRSRPKDRRGYPIPFIALIDTGKRPHFTINDQEKVRFVATKRRCGLCGGKLTDGAWFIGGPRCFLNFNGAFLDPAMHEECARYAIQVCPYLGAPSYGKRIDDRTLSADATPAGMAIVGNAEKMPDDRPPVFGLGRCDAYSIHPTGPQTFIMNNPGQQWEPLEFWQHGKRVDGDELKSLLAADSVRA